jgi:hypothetical protein
MKINAVESALHAGFTAFGFSESFCRELLQFFAVDCAFKWLTKKVERLE